MAVLVPPAMTRPLLARALKRAKHTSGVSTPCQLTTQRSFGVPAPISVAGSMTHLRVDARGDSSACAGCSRSCPRPFGWAPGIVPVNLSSNRLLLLPYRIRRPHLGEHVAGLRVLVAIGIEEPQAISHDRTADGPLVETATTGRSVAGSAIARRASRRSTTAWPSWCGRSHEKAVATALGDHIHDAAGKPAVFRRDTRGENLCLLNRILDEQACSRHPNRLSLVSTPSTRKRLSKPNAPPMATCPAFGVLSVIPGRQLSDLERPPADRERADHISGEVRRLLRRGKRRKCNGRDRDRFLNDCEMSVRSTLTRPPSGTSTICSTIAAPVDSNRIAYVPGGRSRTMYAPITSVLVVRVPWSAGEVTVTDAPGTGRPSGSLHDTGQNPCL